MFKFRIYIYILFISFLVPSQSWGQMTDYLKSEGQVSQWKCGTNGMPSASEQKFSKANNDASIQSAKTVDVGKYLPAKDTLKIAVIWAKFPEDTSGSRDGPDFWDGDGWPNIYGNFIRSSPDSIVGKRKNITNYFNVMSNGKYHVIGNEYTAITDSTYAHYNTTNDGRAKASLNVLKKLNDEIDYSKLDNWTKDYGSHKKESNDLVDMVILIWRGQAWASWGGEASLGYGGSATFDGVEIKTGSPPDNGSGVTVNATANHLFWRSTFHEMAHWLISMLHPYNDDNKPYEHRRVPSMLSISTWGAQSANAWEREQLGWIDVTEIDATTTVIVDEYFDTGKSYKIDPGCGKDSGCDYNYPTSNDGEYYYITYHEQESQYDVWTKDDSDQGIMVFHLKEGSYNEEPAFRHIASDGYWNWEYKGDGDDVYGDDTNPIFERKGARPDTGRGFSDMITFNNDNDEGWIWALSRANGDTLYCNYRAGAHDCSEYVRRSTFSPDHRPLLAPITNPATTTWSGQVSDFGMKVQNIDKTNNEAEVKFYKPYDPYTIAENTTWDGQIFLDSTVTIQSGKQLVIRDSTTLHQKDTVDIVNHGELVIKDTMTFRNDISLGGYEGGGSTTKGKITLYEDVTIADSATVYISSGTRLILKDYADVVVNGKLELESDVDINMGKDGNINVWGQMIASGKTSSDYVKIYGGGSEWNNITFKNGSSGNRLDYTVVQGGHKSVNIESGNNNTLYKTRIKNGWRGLSSDYAANDNKSSVTLKHVILEGNSSVGLVSYHMEPSLSHVTVRDNAQAGVWLYDSYVDHFYKSVVDSNATVDTYREGLEVRSSSDAYIMDNASNEGYTRFENNKGDEICVFSSAGLLYLGIDDSGWQLGGDNALIANDGGDHLVNNNDGTVYADYTYWEPVPPQLGGYGGDITYNEPLSSDPTGSSGASGVPGTSSSSSSTKADDSSDEIVTSESAPAGSSSPNTETRVADSDNGVTLLAEADDPFALARKGAKGVGVKEKSLSREQVDGLAGRMEELMENIKNRSAEKPGALLAELYGLMSLDRKNRTGHHDDIEKMIKNYSSNIHNDDLNTKERKLAERAALIRIFEAKRRSDFNRVGELLDRYEPELMDSDYQSAFLIQKTDWQAANGHYRKALQTLEQAEQASEASDSYPTLEEILAAKVESGDYEKIAADNGANASDKPSAYKLEAAYPNPFNPTTKIRFSLPKTSNVKLTVYNLMGREVATLVNETLQAGRQTVTFDASNLSSGVYLYRLQAEGYTETRKMLLVK